MGPPGLSPLEQKGGTSHIRPAARDELQGEARHDYPTVRRHVKTPATSGFDICCFASSDHLPSETRFPCLRGRSGATSRQGFLHVAPRQRDPSATPRKIASSSDTCKPRAGVNGPKRQALGGSQGTSMRRPGPGDLARMALVASSRVNSIQFRSTVKTIGQRLLQYDQGPTNSRRTRLRTTP